VRHLALATQAARPVTKLAAGATIFTEKAVAVEAAIKATDPAKFKAAYAELTAGMEHVVIKVPDAMVYPNQEFRP
jgi:hypothetical protein